MSDPIRFAPSDDGVVVSIHGKGAMLGFVNILLSAKFSRPLAIERLLGPLLNDLLLEMQTLLLSKHLIAPEILDRAIPDDLVEPLLAAVTSYIEDQGHPKDALEGLLAKAAYPWRYPASADHP